MTRNEVFPSKYLKADDLKGKACVVTIESAPYVTLKGLDGNETKKIVLHFKNAQKTLPLNVTNFNAVCAATSFPDTEDWPGQRIELYPDQTTMGGKAVDCIRIRGEANCLIFRLRYCRPRCEVGFSARRVAPV